MPNLDKKSDVTQPRILIIDDSRVVRVSLRKVLGAEFDIVEAEDGEAGWDALFADASIQVVLTDADMPKLDGYELIARIRAHDDVRISGIPLNMVTAATDEAARQRALGLGATDFITKPFDKVQLLARVRAQARMDQTTRNLAETTEALIEHATDDALTGVRSRRYFLRRGEQDLAYIQRHQQDLCVFVVGIDNFDDLKNQYSATVTDQVLVSIASSLGKAIRKEDTLARCGEAWFAVIAPTLGGNEATTVCNRIREQIAANPYSKEGTQIPLTVSLGLSQHGVDDINKAQHKTKGIEAYLSFAEDYMRKAQTDGGNRLMAAKPTKTTQKRISIDAALRILAKGEPQKLDTHIDTIVEQLMPLLIYCNEQRGWQLDTELKAFQQKINGT
ncbi:MAG: diguanylate cyclase [Ectothiorhodospiraceae bacterium]|nr:diguanylate cyclase [Ectothiorhodospiraceae bacterium]